MKYLVETVREHIAHYVIDAETEGEATRIALRQAAHDEPGEVEWSSSITVTGVIPALVTGETDKMEGFRP